MSEIGIGAENLIGSSRRIEQPVAVYGVTGLPPDQIRRKRQSAYAPRSIASGIGNDVEVLGRFRNRRSRKIRRGQGFESDGGRVFESSPRSGVVGRSGNSALSEVEGLRLRAVRKRVGYPRIPCGQGFYRIGSGGRIPYVRSGGSEPVAVDADPIFAGIGVVRETKHVARRLRVGRVDGLDVDDGSVGKREVVLISGLTVVVEVRRARLQRPRRADFGTGNAENVDGHRRGRSIGDRFPVPFARLGKRHRRARKLVRSGIGRNLEITVGNRRDRRIPFYGIERRKDVGRGIRNSVVRFNSGGRSEIVPLSRSVRSQGRGGGSAGKIKTVPSGSVRAAELFRAPRTAHGILFSERIRAKRLAVDEIDGRKVAVVIERSETADGIGKG